MFKKIYEFFLWFDGIVFFSKEKRMPMEKRKIDALIKKIDEAAADVKAKIDEEG